MVKTFSATDTFYLEKKVRRFLSDFPEKKVLHWKLTARYQKLERAVKFVLRVEFTD